MRTYYDIQYEIIVVDNASTDNTTIYADMHSVSIIHEPRKGIAFARKAGCEEANFDLIACIDADNTITPEWVGTAVEAFHDGKVVAVSGPPVFYGMSRLFDVLMFFYVWITRLVHELFHPMIQGGNFVVRKSAMERIGGYPTYCEFYGEDTSLAAALSMVGKVVVNSKMRISSSPRRLKNHGISRTAWDYAINYLWVALLDRPWSTKYNDYR